MSILFLLSLTSLTACDDKATDAGLDTAADIPTTPETTPATSDDDDTDDADDIADEHTDELANGVTDLDGDGVAEDTDCDDDDRETYPGAPELCDRVDNDCDGLVDEDPVDAPEWYYDGDSDGYGDPDDAVTSCEAPEGFLPADALADCDDTDASINPGAEEHCDGADNDCDGSVDEPDAVDASLWYADEDGDGYGGDDTATACELPADHTTNSDDCDDRDAVSYPGAQEICDAADNDCDAEVDEDAVDALTWYLDSDGDGYGVSAGSARACEVPGGYADNTDDCDNSDPEVHPAAAEVCWDGVDNDCDETSDCRLSGDLASSASDVRFDGESSYDSFGAGLAVHDDATPRLLVGAPAAGSAGLAYEFHADLTANTDASDADASFSGEVTGEAAGVSVAIPGDITADGEADYLVGDPGLDGRRSDDLGACYLIDGPPRGEQELYDSYAIWGGESVSDGAGEVVAGLGDTDGDGSLDFAVGAPDATSSSGRVYVVHTYAAGDRALEDAACILTGASSGDRLGAAVAAIGDLDGDGADDFLVGAPHADLAAGAASNSGVVHLVLGGTCGEGPIDDISYARIFGTSEEAFLGAAVAGAGDVDGDGLPDFVVGAPNHLSGALRPGAAYLFLGASVLGGGGIMASNADAVFVGSTANEEVGAAVTGAGDVDGDGYDDVLIGAPGARDVGVDDGAAYLFYGGPTPDWSEPDLAIYGDAGDRLGQAVAGPIDVDRDGYFDLVIAAPVADDAHPDAGAVRIFLGSGQ